jgi:Uma2 family endonuclease
MSIIETQDDNRVLLTDVSWSMFEALLAETEHRSSRFTYDRGHLEIMSPSRKHERLKKRIGRVVELMAEEQGIPISSEGSLTLRNQMRLRGVEPDECYYVANEARVRDNEEIDLAVDPPPDLAIEVSVSRSALDKLEIYASLGVPEVWQFDGNALRAYHLQPDGTYREVDGSTAFPFLPLKDVAEWLQQHKGTDDTAWSRSVRRWARSLRR